MQDVQAGVREGETEGKGLVEPDDTVVVRKVVLNEGHEALCAEVEEELAVRVFLLLSAVSSNESPVSSRSRRQGRERGNREGRGKWRGNAQPILGLRDLELAVSLKLDMADAQVRSSEVDGEVGTLLLTGRPVEDEGGEHGLSVERR